MRSSILEIKQSEFIKRPSKVSTQMCSQYNLDKAKENSW